MKSIYNLIDLIIVSYTAIFTLGGMNAGNICETIFGCTMLMMWFLRFNKEN